MANEQNEKKRRQKKLRQQWNPHWLIKLFYTACSVFLSALKIAVGAGATAALIILISGLVFLGALGDYLQTDILSDAANWSYEDYDLEKTSYVHYVDRDGKIQLLQQIYTTTDRQPAAWEDIPQALKDATVAIEDKRFYEHQGVDWITTVKACANMFFGGDSQFGGSTITQQLVKNTTDEKSITVQRKVMEIFRAQLLEKEYDKDVIMREYLNRIYLGRGCYGVKSAAASYFGKELQSLTVAECASLISITNNPSLFNPYSDNVFTYKGEERDGAGRNRYRQLNVLSEMLSQGYLSQKEYDDAVAQEMVFKDGIADEDRWAVCDHCGYGGIVSSYAQEGANYYCPQCGTLTSVSKNASQHIYSWFVDAVIIDVASDLAAKDGFRWDDMEQNSRNYYLEKIQKGGYHIYTTLDKDVQEQVDAIYTDLSKIPTTRSTQQLQSGIVVIDNSTGDIVALSGGVGEKTDFFAYNKATQAKLQTGSSQKPLSVYAPAFEKGLSPATVIKDLPLSYNGGAFPKNDSRTYNYARTIFQGIVSSVNTIAAGTLNRIGTEYAYSFAKYNFGQKNLVDNYQTTSGQVMSDIAVSPLALGALTVGATVRQMSAAYATFPNNGVYREPRTYTKVYNSEGDIILDNKQDSRQILTDKTVSYMNYCLYNAANFGTGAAAVFQGQNIAGKTGTTSSNKDRWFCGFTKYYTAAVWCGYNQPEAIYLTGNNTSNPAARLWRMVMQPIHQGKPAVGLFNGNNFSTVNICLDSGLVATAACANDARGISRVSTVNCFSADIPTGTCNKHVSVEYCVTGGGVASEYCAHFPDAVIQTRSLVRLNQSEIDEIKAALNVGLDNIYGNDGYVYLVDYSGNAMPWSGFYGNVNNGGHPYLICPLHTAESWENFAPETPDDYENMDNTHDTDEDPDAFWG